MLHELVMWLFSITLAVTAVSYSSTGITSFHWTPLTTEPIDATETEEMQIDCARECLQHYEEVNATFCYGFALVNTKCVIVNSSLEAESGKYIAYYRVSLDYKTKYLISVYAPDDNYRQFLFDGYHYALELYYETSRECERDCDKMAFDMISIHSVEQNNFIGRLCELYVPSNSFGIKIGLNRTMTDPGNYFWSDGTPYVEEEAHWRDDQPSGDGDCFGLEDYAWAVNRCHNSMSCLCWRAIGIGH